jgi:hypothetical protein
VQAGEQRGQQTHYAGAGDNDSATPHAVGETAYIGAMNVGSGME